MSGTYQPLSAAESRRCNRCHHFIPFYGRPTCPKCAQRCHSPEDNPQACYLSILTDRCTKYVALKQTFLSRWYSSGGCSAKVERIIALFNPAQHERYTEYQRDWLASKVAKGVPDPAMNERRLFIPFYPKYTCTQFLPAGTPPPGETGAHSLSSSGHFSGSLTPRSGELPQRSQPLSYGEHAVQLSNTPVSPCGDPDCELCTWLTSPDGIPQTTCGRTGCSGRAHYMSYEPLAGLRPPEASRQYSLTLPERTHGRKVRICVLCRVLVGESAWGDQCLFSQEENQMTQSPNRRGTTPTNKGHHSRRPLEVPSSHPCTSDIVSSSIDSLGEANETSPRAPSSTTAVKCLNSPRVSCSAFPERLDSLVVEARGATDVVVFAKEAVIPVYALVCSSPY